jgi:hypothetical protein
MHYLVILLAFACFASPASAQSLTDLPATKRVRVYSDTSIHTGKWIGIRDTVAVMSEGEKLVAIPLSSIDSLKVFKKETGRVALATGIVAGFIPAVMLGGYHIGSDCGSQNCIGSQIAAGSLVFVVFGAIGALVGAAVGTEVGNWVDYYGR